MSPHAVTRNRALLRDAADLPAEPHWLEQVHGCGVCMLDTAADAERCADAAVAFGPGRVCAVMTADCLPVLLCDRDGSAVAAVHAGWRGLADGALEAAVRRMGRPPARLLAWLGPAIGAEAFEVGDEVRARFCAGDPGARAAFRPSRAGGWLADLGLLARRRLGALGLTRIGGCGLCTFSEPARFFSYRRDGTTGRMASLIWLAAD